MMSSGYTPVTGSSCTIKVMMFGSVPPQSLNRHFSQFGTITNIHPYFEPGSTHNWGTYITFANREAARAALIENDLLVGGFRVQVYQHTGSIPRHTAATIHASPSPQRPKTVKVSMFNGQLTADEIKQLVKQFGPLKSEPAVFPNGEPPYSYINFNDAGNAERACVSIHETQQRGVLLKARLCESKSNSHSSVSSSITTPPAACTTQYPNTWQPGQTNNTELFEVLPQSPEWREVVAAIRETMPQARLVSIKRIQNKELYEEYDHKKQRMIKKNKPLNERNLFHGSRNTQPTLIYESDKGIDFRFSGEGLWGQGAYFAEKASFADLYSYKSPHSHREIFMATVLTGETCWMTKEDKTLRIPPLKPGSSTERYDSVSAYHDGGSNIFVVYEHDMAYPVYLILYISN